MADISKIKLPDGNEYNIKDTTARATYQEKMYFSKSGAFVSFDDGVGGKLVNKLIVDIEPVQAGSGDPSPSNVRPITGRTTASVTWCGKNLFPNVKRVINAANVMIGQTASYTAGWDIHLAPGTYTASATLTKACYLKYRNKDGTISGNSTLRASPSVQITVSAEDDFAFWIYLSGGVVPDNITSFQLERGSVVTSYDPYAGEVFNVTFPTQAGTVYGGRFDLTAGTLTVDRVFLSLDGSETWTRQQSALSENAAYFSMKIGELWDVYDRTGVCSHFTAEVIDSNATTTDSNTTTTGQRIVNSTALGIAALFIRPENVASLTVESFKSWLAGQANANTPVQITYQLRTPTVYSLTPVQILMLEGFNIVWADCGDILNLKYINNFGWELLKSVENGLATTSRAGLMSAEDKEKLDSITPLRMNNGTLEYFDGSTWTAVPLGQ